MDNKFVAYRGEKYTVEWFFDLRSKSQALEYFNTLSKKERTLVLRLFKRIGDLGELRDSTKFNYEGDQIYAFKPKPDRFLCFFFEDKKIIVTNAFRKKKDKLPPEEKERALRNRNGYQTRLATGEYYEEFN
ncbi:MAG: type II toxin-antitoxin system RelE/ParE family toxin [Gammaproteobacteria bacterium]|nr:type II toxin-antitoxin system RelE/ParE family toxin [Gammaproteobacteria bacterium]